MFKRNEMKYDILHSNCRECFINNLRCTYYYDFGCRYENNRKNGFEENNVNK